MEILSHKSPNHGPRRSDVIDTVVLHYTVLDEVESLNRLCDPEAEVSAHYLIADDGRIFQLVAETERAWHAGVSYWAGARDVNSRSVGIELANDGQSPFADSQLQALVWLLPRIMGAHGIRPANVVGHSDVAPGRKSDPGPHFPWQSLARKGLAAFLSIDAKGPMPDDGPARFHAAMVRAGYDPDAQIADLLSALRLRFRPEALGDALSLADVTLAETLARKLPAVDGSGHLV
jgi:N-acetylmuramoyl-L-alanine amidase